MSESPLVSVITPCYNHAKYIGQTIESVLKQTYKNIEYFVIDDGSTDDSAEVIQRLKEKDNFNFEVQQNKGLAFTMNKLIARCNGKYIAVVESDDVWTLDKIEKQVAFLESHPELAVCGGNAVCIDENNEVLPPEQQNFQKYTVYNLKEIMSFNWLIWPLTVMMRREVYDAVGTYDESLLFIDAYTWIQIAIHKYPIVILPYHLGYYRIHESNVHYNSLKMHETLKATVQKFKGHSMYKQLKRNTSWFIFPYLTIKDKREAIKILPQAFRFQWRIIKGLIVLIVPYSIIRYYTKTRYK